MFSRLKLRRQLRDRIRQSRGIHRNTGTIPDVLLMIGDPGPSAAESTTSPPVGPEVSSKTHEPWVGNRDPSETHSSCLVGGVFL
jgi:hypothetical protein